MKDGTLCARIKADAWVDRSLAFARALPPKKPKAKKKA
jgi:hypothetical protein